MPRGSIRQPSVTSEEHNEHRELRVRRLPARRPRSRKSFYPALTIFSARTAKLSDVDGTSTPRGTPADGRPRLRMVGGPIRYAVVTKVPRGAAPSGVDSAVPAESGALRRLARVVFINQNFALLWWGQAISSVGDYAWDTALVLWIATFLAKGRSWAPLAISGVLLAATVPQIVIGPIAGVFVDRMDKRRTMIVATLLQAIFASLLVLLLGGSWLTLFNLDHLPVLWQLVIVYADVTLITICSQFFIPAQFALIKDIVPPERQDQAIETSQAIQGLAIILGPPIAAILVFGLGVPWALLLNVVSFVVSLLATIAIIVPPISRRLANGAVGTFFQQFLDGFGYVLSHSVLRTILVSEVLTWLGLGALQTLGYFFITQNLSAPPGAYGIFGAVFGVGAIGGAVAVTTLGERIGLPRVLWVGLIISGLFVTLMSHLTTLTLALVAAFFFGVSATAIIVTASALALRVTAREFVGRVTSVLNPVGKLASLLSIAIAGYLVSSVLDGFHATFLGLTFGPVDTIFTGMGLLAIAGGIFAWTNLRSA
jgi:MFS family permease